MVLLHFRSLILHDTNTINFSMPRLRTAIIGNGRPAVIQALKERTFVCMAIVLQVNSLAVRVQTLETTNTRHDKPKTRQTIDRQTIDTTNARHNKHKT